MRTCTGPSSLMLLIPCEYYSSQNIVDRFSFRLFNFHMAKLCWLVSDANGCMILIHPFTRWQEQFTNKYCCLNDSSMFVILIIWTLLRLKEPVQNYIPATSLKPFLLSWNILLYASKFKTVFISNTDTEMTCRICAKNLGIHWIF